MKNFLFWIGFWLIGILVPLTALELAGRAYISVKHGVDGKSYGLWRADSVLGAVHKENAYNTNAQTNNLGFRNLENVSSEKPADELRLIAYGGSTTFCYNLTNEQAWPLQLQDLINAQLEANSTLLNSNAYSRAQVLNGGAILWSIGHAYARAKQDLPIVKPDYVIIYSGINEEINAAHLNAQGRPLEVSVQNAKYGEFATNLDQNRWAKRNLFIVRLFDYVIQPMFAGSASTKTTAFVQSGEPAQSSELPDPSVEKNYQEVLVEFLSLIKQHNAQAIFVAQAHGINTQRNRRYTAYSQRAMDLARDHGAIVLDAQTLIAASSMPNRKLFTDSGVHYTEQGAKALAQYIFDNAFEENLEVTH